MLSRDDIENKYKWDIDNFKKDLDKENKIKEVNKLVDNIKEYKNKILDNDNLLKVLDLKKELDLIMSNYYIYSNMKLHEDISNNENQKYRNEIEDIYTNIEKELSFITPEILKNDYKVIEEKIKNYKDLEQYKFYLEKLFRYKKHTLSEKEEKILSSLSSVLSSFDKIYEVFTCSELEFKKIKNEDNKLVDFNEIVYSKYIKSNNRNIRKNAFNNLFDGYRKYQNTLFENYIPNIKTETTIANIRGFDSALEASLYNDNINKEVYVNLINIINNNLGELQKYLDIKKDMLNVDELHMYDLYAPIIKDYTKEYTYEEAIEIVKNSLSILGKDYKNILDKVFSENWIDVYPNKNKRNGAYSWGTYESKPYILTNYNKSLNSISTLAHEIGHSIHSYLSNQNQKFIYSSYPIVLAEIASITNELLFNDYMLKNTNSKEEKIYILSNILELYRTTLFRQTMFAEFEYDIHSKVEENVTLSCDSVNEIYYDLNKKYFGENIKIDDKIKYEWLRIPHFFNNFYVYKYATGLCVASAIAGDIINNVEGVKEKYIKFLSSGCSKYPLELLNDLGYKLDDPNTIEKSISLFKKYIKDLEKLK